MLITDDAVEVVLGVSGTDLAEAKGRRWFHRRAALRPGTAFSWNDLNRVLQYGNLGPDQVRLVGGSVSGDELFRSAIAGGARSYCRVVPEAAHRALATGGTLVVDQLDLIDPWADQVSRALSAIFTTRVQANLYASLRGAPGFGMHQDTHDVFVVQGSGRKHWTLGTGSTSTHVTLTCGDVLYLPEGTGHDVATDARGSLHITFAVPRPNVQELLSWKLTTTRDPELLTPVDAVTTDVEDRYRTPWGAGTTSAEVRAFLEAGLSSGMPPAYVNFPYAGREVAESPDPTKLLARRSFVSVLPDEATDHAEVLGRLKAAEELPVSELVSTSGVNNPLEVILELAQLGLISLSER